MSIDMVIKNGKVVTAGHTHSADIGIDKGKFIVIGDAGCMPSAAKVINAQGKYVLPGLVDPHVHLGFLEPFELACQTETRAGIAGGVTTMGVYMPYKPDQGIVKVLGEAKGKYQANAHCDAFFHVFIRDQAGLDDIAHAPEVGITSFKFSIGYKRTPSQDDRHDQCGRRLLLRRV